jgi:hypothetical protein
VTEHRCATNPARLFRKFSLLGFAYLWTIAMVSYHTDKEYYCHFTNELCFSYYTAKKTALWEEARFNLQTSSFTYRICVQTHWLTVSVIIQTATEFDRIRSLPEIIRILWNPHILQCSQEPATGHYPEPDESSPTFRVLWFILVLRFLPYAARYPKCFSFRESNPFPTKASLIKSSNRMGKDQILNLISITKVTKV